MHGRFSLDVDPERLEIDFQPFPTSGDFSVANRVRCPCAQCRWLASQQMKPRTNMSKIDKSTEPDSASKAASSHVGMSNIRLTSNALCNTPGVLRWAMHGYKFKRDRKAMVAVFTEGYGLTEQCARDLLSGKTPHIIDVDAVVFEYPANEWRKEVK